MTSQARSTITTIRAAAVCGALLSGAVVGAPAAASESSVMGAYSFAAEDGENATWSLGPCPDDPPGCVRVAEFGNSERAPWSGEAHYSVGSWILFVEQPDAILCEDGTSAPGRNTYSWDNATLAGNVSIFSNGACGAKPRNVSIPFRLTKTGSTPPPPPAAPAPPAATQPPAAPAAPIEGPAPSAVPVPAPSAPLPAESPVGN